MDTFRNLRDKHLVLHPPPGSFTAEGDSARWSNADLDPVPETKKKWEWYHVGGFWIAEGFNAAQMQVPSSAVSIGLNPGLAVVACLIGNLLVTFPVCVTGYLGAKYSINFPVIARSSYGMVGAYVAMTIRGVFCVILYGVIASLGGNAVRCMIEGIWPSFASWHLNSLPASAEITAPDLLCFSIFWLLSFPFLLISITSLRWMFLVKIVLMPFFYVALMTWGLTAGHGTGPLFSIPNKITNGWSVGYVFCSTILATIGGNATFAINMADITRYARSPRDCTIAQAVALPVMITLIELLGAILAATSQVVYGEVQWNPLLLVLEWDNRAAKFFAGLLFAFAMIGTNIAGNSVPFANDLMGIFPKYINIRRGQVICAIIGYASCPWAIQAKSTRFFSFIGGYSIFLGPVVGVLLSDYFLVTKRKDFNIVQLYKPHGIYWYNHGWNFRAIVALLSGIAPLLPGLIYNINPVIPMARGIIEFYTLGWLDGLIISLVIYYLLNLAFPYKPILDQEDIHVPVVTDGSNSGLEEKGNSDRVKIESIDL
ncbi:hypothetical protein B7463_g8166, partial [Scytalidium lignicola]